MTLPIETLSRRLSPDALSDGLPIGFKGLGVTVDSVTSPFFPIPNGRQSVSFQCQIGADDGPFWVQPYIDWGVLDDTQDENTLIVGTQAVGPPYIFGGSSIWTQIDFTVTDVPDDSEVWQPYVIVVTYDPSDPDAVVTGVPDGFSVYIDCIYIPENGLSVAGQPYLDGDQPYGIWEGTPHHATSLLLQPGQTKPPEIDESVALPDSLIV